SVGGVGSGYGQGGGGSVVMVALFGAGWGISQIFFGLAVEAVGIALAFSIILGIAAVVGSLIPLIRLHPEKILTAGGAAVLAGIALMLIGIGLFAVAGRRRGTGFGGGATGQPAICQGLFFFLISRLC